MRSLIDDLAGQREAIVINSERVRTSIVSAQESLSMDLRLASESIAENVTHSGNRITVALTRGQQGGAAEWLRSRIGVAGLSEMETRLEFGFHGNETEQAELLADFIAAGFRPRAFEEKRSSFEEMLVGVAEGNLTK